MNMLVSGVLTIAEYRKHQVMRVTRACNRVVWGGRSWAWQRLCGYNSERLFTLAVGDGDLAVVDVDDALASQVYSAALTSLIITGDVLTCEYYLPSGIEDVNGKTLCEAGLLTTENTLFARIVHAPIEKSGNNSLLYSWEITLSVL